MSQHVRRKSARAGFTLLEVLVATAIMAVAVAGVLSGLSNAVRNADRLTQHDKAVLLARQKMDELLADDTLTRRGPIGGFWTPAQAGGLNAGWQGRVVPFETLQDSPMGQGPAPGSLVIDRIELEVWWMEGQTRHSFSLEGIRRAIMRQENQQ